MYARSPRLMLLGLVPALISFVALLVAASSRWCSIVDDVVGWMTPVRRRLAECRARDTARIVATVAIAAVWVVLSLLLFTALTLLIGQPFYEAISKRVEDQLGGVPGEINVSFWKTLPRTHRATRSGWLLLAAVLRYPRLPASGSSRSSARSSAPVLGASARRLGARGRAHQRPVRAARAALRGTAGDAARSAVPMALGFGVATFVCFLIPLGAILVMPAAVAGATLLSPAPVRAARHASTNRPITPEPMRIEARSKATSPSQPVDAIVNAANSLADGWRRGGRRHPRQGRAGDPGRVPRAAGGPVRARAAHRRGRGHDRRPPPGPVGDPHRRPDLRARRRPVAICCARATRTRSRVADELGAARSPSRSSPPASSAGRSTTRSGRR